LPAASRITAVSCPFIEFNTANHQINTHYAGNCHKAVCNAKSLSVSNSCGLFRFLAETPVMTESPPDLVFDLDGTLIDSAPDLHAALNRLMKTESRRMLDLSEVIPMVGDGVPMLVRRALEATGGIPENYDEILKRYHAIYGSAVADLTKAYPGVAETLETLSRAGHRMGICTNKPEAATHAVLQALDLARFFSAVAGGDSLPVRKPDAGHLLGTLAMLGSTPERAVMIGDSHNDIQVAINAAVRSIAVSYGYRRHPVEELGADMIVDKFVDIPGALTRLNGAP
jgi:phosphoglycolate phosphatase